MTSGVRSASGLGWPISQWLPIDTRSPMTTFPWICVHGPIETPVPNLASDDTRASGLMDMELNNKPSLFNLGMNL